MNQNDDCHSKMKLNTCNFFFNAGYTVCINENYVGLLPRRSVLNNLICGYNQDSRFELKTMFKSIVCRDGCMNSENGALISKSSATLTLKTFKKDLVQNREIHAPCVPTYISTSECLLVKDTRFFF